MSEQSVFHRQLVKSLLVLFRLLSVTLIWVYQLLHALLIPTQPPLHIQRVDDLLPKPPSVQLLNALLDFLRVSPTIPNFWQLLARSSSDLRFTTVPFPT